MTAFLLVGDAHTGGRLWDGVAERLRAAGAGVLAPTPAGMAGETGPPAAGEIDLTVHIDDVVRALDAAEEPQLVLVGHGYGIHPVLGAAALRADRVSRIVHLDAGIPGDGDTAAAGIPDPAVHAHLAEGSGPVPPPAGEGWAARGSLAGVSPEALARLDAQSAAQPAATLTEPLRLTEAVFGIPRTGVLCAGNGSSLTGVETLVRLGGPVAAALTAPGTRFFELDTGHWPMLSVPDELAAVLLAAADGGGHRVAAPAESAERPFPVAAPVVERERRGRVDLHLPAGADPERPLPAVVFVHGGPVPRDVEPTPRDFGTYLGYARATAAGGAVAAVVDHRLHSPADYPLSAEDVAAAVALVRADPRVDGERIAVWYFSGGGLLTAEPLAAPPAWLRCLAATYPVLAPPQAWGRVDPRFRPVEAVAGAGGGRLPIVLTRVGRESAEFAAGVEEFLVAARRAGAAVDLVDVPEGRHGFELLDPPEVAEPAVRAALSAVLGHLSG